MRQGIEILVAYGGQIAKKDAAVCVRFVLFAAVNRNRMPACGEPRGKLLGECLKTAIARRNPSCPEDSDAHRRTSAVGCFGPRAHLEDFLLLRRGPAHRFVTEPGGDLFT